MIVSVEFPYKGSAGGVVTGEVIADDKLSVYADRYGDRSFRDRCNCWITTYSWRGRKSIHSRLIV